MLVVATKPFSGDPPVTDDDGAITVPIDLDDGFRRPGDGTPVRGQRVTVPATAESMVLAAEADDRLAVRLGTEAVPGDWVELRYEPEEGPDGVAADGLGGEGSVDGIRALPPLLIDLGTDRLEIVRLGDGGGELAVTFLESADAVGAPSVAGRQQLSTDEVSVVPRTSWTSNGWSTDNDGCASGPWYADNLQALVVHHTVTGNSYSADQVDDLLRAMHYAHVEINGWCDIGYNFVVDRFGTVWEGRSGGVDRPVIGGHAKGFNTGTVGVALLGQHQQGARPTAVSPTSAAAAAVTGLAQWKLGLYGVDPLGTTWLKNRSSRGPHKLAAGQWHRVPTVLSHRDLGLTSCPGSLSLGLVRGLGRTLAAESGPERPYHLAAWSAAGHGPGFVVVDSRGGTRAAGSAALPGMGVPGSLSDPAALPSPAAVSVATAGQGPTTGGYVLHADGILHPFGSAPGVADRPAGDTTVVDLGLAGVGAGGWVISAQGGVHGFGGRPDLAPPDPSAPVVVRGDLTPEGNGYLLLADGTLEAIGSAPPHQPEAIGADAVDVAVRPTGDSGWILTANGRLHSFGGAPAVAVDSPGGLPAGLGVRALAASASGHGGWVLSEDGQLWAFGAERLILPLTTKAATADAVDLAPTGSYLPAQFLAGPTARYLDGLSRLFLGRPAQPVEIDYWDGWMTYRGGRVPVARQLARSNEWAGRSIENMYLDVLGRPADPAGIDYWLGQIARGVPVQEIGVYFYGSEEYVQDVGSNAGYVERLYDRLLGRAGDPAGVAYWSGQLDTGQAKPPDVAAGFYSSIESRTQRVRALYQSVLGRGPDIAGGAYWAQRLGEVDDVILAAELAASDEFYLLTLE